MNYDMKQSGERIRQLRIKNGLTQEKIAETLNIDRSFYSRIEFGKNGCSVDLFIQLSDVFEVSLDYLILGRNLVVFAKSTESILLKEDMEKLMDHLERFMATF